ncbi:hypothetical protein OE88DRAFT_1108331 [Heliocybe sulcata]|uniref:DUF7330 domain-containing protein n=1 Tax=Heliocybe sulcata TaxID=5364 RepID=A0A5C3MNM7_9AGAM|nr:hypothetical protein OE88DRAFT_1108331 [Heliocybe sulcata]
MADASTASTSYEDPRMPLLPSYSSDVQAVAPDIPEKIRNVRPGNYLHISRTESIEGTYVIDPLWEPRVPAYMLQTPEGCGHRDNLALRSEGSWVKADVWIRPGSAAPLAGVVKTKQRTSIKLSGSDIEAHLHANPNDLFFLQCDATSHLVVYLPQNYKGLLVAKSTRGSVRYSQGVAARLTVLSEVRGTHQCLIGPDSNSSRGAVNVQSSELHLSSNGYITVAFIDDGLPLRVPSIVPLLLCSIVLWVLYRKMFST